MQPRPVMVACLLVAIFSVWAAAPSIEALDLARHATGRDTTLQPATNQDLQGVTELLKKVKAIITPSQAAATATASQLAATRPPPSALVLEQVGSGLVVKSSDENKEPAISELALWQAQRATEQLGAIKAMLIRIVPPMGELPLRAYLFPEFLELVGFIFATRLKEADVQAMFESLSGDSIPYFMYEIADALYHVWEKCSTMAVTSRHGSTIYVLYQLATLPLDTVRELALLFPVRHAGRMQKLNREWTVRVKLDALAEEIHAAILSNSLFAFHYCTNTPWPFLCSNEPDQKAVFLDYGLPDRGFWEPRRSNWRHKFREAVERLGIDALAMADASGGQSLRNISQTAAALGAAATELNQRLWGRECWNRELRFNPNETEILNPLDVVAPPTGAAPRELSSDTVVLTLLYALRALCIPAKIRLRHGDKALSNESRATLRPVHGPLLHPEIDYYNGLYWDVIIPMPLQRADAESKTAESALGLDERSDDIQASISRSDLSGAPQIRSS